MSKLTIEKLAAIAYFARKISGGSTSGSLFSYETSRYYNFSISSEGPVIGVFDYQRGNYLTGNKKTNGWSVFDYTTGSYMDFNVKSSGYSVFDYFSGSYIDIKFKNNQIELYSYLHGRYFNFS